MGVKPSNYNELPKISDLSNCYDISSQIANFSEYEMSGNEIKNPSDASFCYVKDLSNCETDMYSLNTVYTDVSGDISYNYCGKKKTSQTITHSISNETKSLGINTFDLPVFFMIIVYVFISVLLYAVFGVAAYIFWTEYASNITIESGCHLGTTLLDRHYPYKPYELPYNIDKLGKCKNPTRVAITSFDKCPPPKNVALLQETVKITGESIWDHVFYFIQGFPYNGISPAKEDKFKDVNGNYLLFTIVVSMIFFGTLYINGKPRDTWDTIASGLLSIGILGSLILFAIVGKDYTGIDISDNKTFKIIGLFLFGLIIIVSIINRLINNSNTILITCLGFCLAFLFSCGWLAKEEYDKKDSGGSSVDKDIRFFSAMMKAGYYFKKVFINSFKSSTMNSRHWINKIIRVLGDVGLPNWFIILGGKIILPIIMIVAVIARIGAAAAFTIPGALSWQHKINDDKLEKYNQAKIKQEELAGKSGFISQMASKREMVRSNVRYREAQMDTLWSAISLFPFTLLILPVLYSFINLIFFILSYHLVPLTYPKIIMNIISCNIKSLGFLFGISLLITLWTLYIKFYFHILPKNILISMTITFVVISIYNWVMG